MSDNQGGRPTIGPAVNTRLGVDLLEAVDAYATRRGITRADAIRELLDAGLRRQQCDQAR